MPFRWHVPVALTVVIASFATTSATPALSRAPLERGTVQTAPPDDAGIPSLVGVQALCRCSCNFQGTSCQASGIVCVCAVGLDLNCTCAAFD